MLNKGVLFGSRLYRLSINPKTVRMVNFKNSYLKISVQVNVKYAKNLLQKYISYLKIRIQV